MRILVVYGPEGSGKTRNAEGLREYFDCAHVVDDWYDGPGPLKDNSLLLTTLEPPYKLGVTRAFRIVDALRRMRAP